MKNKIISVLLATLIVLSVNGCGSNVVTNAENTQEQVEMFERHKLGSGYSILVDKETGVCYLEKRGGYHYQYGITIILNADGTPKIWEKNGEQ